MSCNGKCHLKKELKKSADAESKNKSVASQSIQEELLTQNVFVLTLIFNIKDPITCFFYLENYTSNPLEYNTPPPQV